MTPRYPRRPGSSVPHLQQDALRREQQREVKSFVRDFGQVGGRAGLAAPCWSPRCQSFWLARASS